VPRTVSLSHFKGLNNRRDIVGGGNGWLRKADNINIRSNAGIERRDGYTRKLTGVLSAGYSTRDHARFYIIDAGDLKQVHADFSTVVLRSGLLSTAQVHWTEVNNEVYFSNGVDSGIISSNGVVSNWAWPVPTTPNLAIVGGNLDAGQYRVHCTFILPDGRETGSCAQAAVAELPQGSALQIIDIPQQAACKTRVYIAPADSTVFQLAFETTNTAELWNAPSTALGSELVTYGLFPLQSGWGVHQYWRGNMYVSFFMPQEDVSAIFISESFGFHLFNVSEKAVMVPGECVMIAPHNDGLVIGTKTELYAYTGEQLIKLANYGAVAGRSWVIDDDDNTLYFWTTRGVCKGLPFENLTEDNVSVPPGVCGGCSIIRTRGDKRFVVSLSGQGVASNQRFIL